MIHGIGNDIIEVDRIAKVIDKHGERFLSRIFTPAEQEYCLKHKDSACRFAGKFAAKESVAKALGTGFGSFLNFTDIEISNQENGKPYVSLSLKANEDFNDPQFLITVSHCRKYASAVAIWIA